MEKEEIEAFEALQEERRIKFTVEVIEVNIEYAGCGTHLLLLNGVASIEELQELYRQLSEIKGIAK